MTVTSASPIRSTRAIPRHWVLGIFSLAAVAIAATTLLWPSFGLVCAALVVVAALAITAPSYAFVVVLLLYGLEGSIKIRFWLEGTPLVSRESAVGAGMIDVAFFIALAGILWADHGRTLVATWKLADRWTRAGIALLGAWLVVSVLELPHGGTLKTSLEAFRLTQIYVLAMLAGATLLARNRNASRVLDALLTVLLVVAAYATVRTIVGPSASERAFALSRDVTSIAATGSVFRNVGSFSGATGLVSYLLPACVFAFLLGALQRRHRVLAWSLFALAIAGIAGAYIRSAFVVGAVGIVVALVLLYERRGRVLRSNRATVVAACLLLVLAAGAAAVAFDRSATLSRYAANIVHPSRDRSTKIRIRSLKRSVHVIAAHPLGTGLGTFHGSDSSYLTITREEGVAGGALFVFGMIALLVGLARGLRRRWDLPRSVAVGAFGATLAIALYWLAWDSIQQPGKVLTWSLLGMGLVAAWSPVAPSEPERETTPGEPAERRAPASKLVRQAVRGVQPGVLVGGLLAGLVLAVATAAVWAPRTRAFDASRRLTAVPHGHPRQSASRYLRRLVRMIRADAARGWGTVSFNPATPDSRLLSRTVVVGSRSVLSLTTSAGTPELARDVVNDTSRKLILFNRSFGSPYRLEFGPPAAAPRPTEVVDRVAASVPGAFPARTSLGWAVVAALLVAALLTAAATVLQRAWPAQRG
jgi:hypothetical protein